MTEEQIFIGHIKDLARRSYDKNIYTYTGFLTLPEQALLERMSSDLAISHALDGGYDMAERKIACFGSEDVFGYAADFPISVIQISPLSEKYSEKLNHRDYLGALMNLGIDRSVIGDILLKDNRAYLYVLSDMKEHICDELTRVRHTAVSTVPIAADIPELKPEIVTESHPVSSLRIDVVISTLCKLSRKEALAFFERHEVSLNGKPIYKNAYTLKVGDTFSVRGKGKFRIEKLGGVSKRGKTYVDVGRYK